MKKIILMALAAVALSGCNLEKAGANTMSPSKPPVTKVDGASDSGGGEVKKSTVEEVVSAIYEARELLMDEEFRDSMLANISSFTDSYAAISIRQRGIPGLDTPNNLYKQLKAERADRCTSHSGYVGFQIAGNGYSLRVSDA